MDEKRLLCFFFVFSFVFSQFFLIFFEGGGRFVCEMGRGRGGVNYMINWL